MTLIVKFVKVKLDGSGKMILKNQDETYGAVSLESLSS